MNLFVGFSPFLAMVVPKYVPKSDLPVHGSSTVRTQTEVIKDGLTK